MKIHGTPNARFWDYVGGGWVKITLRPGEELIRDTGGPCDEGYSYKREGWTHERDHVAYRWASDSRDCDGRYQDDGKLCCPLADLRARDALDPELPDATTGPWRWLPVWGRARRSQRDFTAEAAGY